MNRLRIVIGLALLLIAQAPILAQTHTKSGAAKFSVGGAEVNIALGTKVKLKTTLKAITVGPATAVSVAGTVNNTASVKMNYSYNVAFLDKDKNLIGCQQFNLFLDPGKDGRVGTFINLPPDQIARIAFYTVAYYESDKQIGTK
jgi:hypothetical protein